MERDDIGYERFEKPKTSSSRRNYLPVGEIDSSVSRKSRQGRTSARNYTTTAYDSYGSDKHNPNY